MAELFGVESHTITYHLKEIYKTGELEETATARKIRVVQKEREQFLKTKIMIIAIVFTLLFNLFFISWVYITAKKCEKQKVKQLS